MEASKVIECVKNFLKQYLSNYEVANDENIFGKGLVNSLFAMQLVLFLENTFSLHVENEDLDINNFKTLNSIADFVKRKQNAVIS